MVNFMLDSDSKTVKVQLKLKGEERDLTFNIDKYNIIKEDGKLFLNLSGIQTNREWLNILIEKQFKEHKIEIPEKYEALLHIIL